METIYKIANGENAKPANINIKETTITGNQAYYQMEKNKLMWKGIDDGSVREPPHPKDKAGWNVALQPQRIRSFEVEFVEEEKFEPNQ